MSTFKIKMKLTGFELEIEGSRDDMPGITNALSQQLMGLIQPTHGLIDITPNPPPQKVAGGMQQADTVTTPRKRAKKRASSTASVEDEPNDAVDFVHDAEKYGSPNQAWSTATKAQWILYVIKEAKGLSALSTRGVTQTFNKHFKQAKQITVRLVNRDLGKLKTRKLSPVSEDTTKQPAEWYLTNEGIKGVQKLIADSLGTDASSN
jgi:hypothetical protein